MSRTKIVATIGPASASKDTLRELIEHGLRVARLNFSHGSHEDHQRMFRRIRQLSGELNQPVAVLQDLCGPKIRLGRVREPGVRLEPGQRLVLTNREIEGTAEAIGVNYRDLPREVRPGDRLMLADGMLELGVVATSATDIICDVIIGGLLTSHKGINLPTGSLNTEALTPKDKADLAFGLDLGVDYVALSFVRSAADIGKIKTLIARHGADTPVIAKIEKHEALDNIAAILEAADGIMVARGDLGVEIPLASIAGIQKDLIRRANRRGKPVIIATQMLRSMVDAPRPTRAEATDVANAVLDGADGVMLSEETASGNYPVEAVRFMDEIIRAAEKDYPHGRHLQHRPAREVPDSVAHSSCLLADHLEAAAIVAPTFSGFTARLIAHFRPRAPIVALSPNESVVRRLNLFWGVRPFLFERARDTDEMIAEAARKVQDVGLAGIGDTVVITAGHPVWEQGTTKMLRVKRLK